MPDIVLRLSVNIDQVLVAPRSSEVGVVDDSVLGHVEIYLVESVVAGIEVIRRVVEGYSDFVAADVQRFLRCLIRLEEFFDGLVVPKDNPLPNPVCFGL